MTRLPHGRAEWVGEYVSRSRGLGRLRRWAEEDREFQRHQDHGVELAARLVPGENVVSRKAFGSLARYLLDGSDERIRRAHHAKRFEVSGIAVVLDDG